MANISFHPAAEADYRAALAWYMARGLQTAAKFEAAIQGALQTIADNPDLWPFCDDRHRCYVLRRYPYSIIYRVDGGDVVVIAVPHSRRSSSYWQGRP